MFHGSHHNKELELKSLAEKSVCSEGKRSKYTAVLNDSVNPKKKGEKQKFQVCQRYFTELDFVRFTVAF